MGLLFQALERSWHLFVESCELCTSGELSRQRQRGADLNYWRQTMYKRSIASALCIACLMLITAAEARSSYDGPWNLVFHTQRGSCDPTYTFSVDVTDGKV